jgi:hypothetical protein
MEKMMRLEMEKKMKEEMARMGLQMPQKQPEPPVILAQPKPNPIVRQPEVVVKAKVEEPVQPIIMPKVSVEIK